jgi:hypothetical protein
VAILDYSNGVDRAADTGLVGEGDVQVVNSSRPCAGIPIPILHEKIGKNRPFARESALCTRIGAF